MINTTVFDDYNDFLIYKYFWKTETSDHCNHVNESVTPWTGMENYLNPKPEI